MRDRMMATMAVLGFGIAGCAAAETDHRATDATEQGETIIHETFDAGMDGWWVEGDAEVWVEDGRLYVDADPLEMDAGRGVATIWYSEPIRGDVKVEFDAHVLESQVGANNINVFLFFSDPAGDPLYETRQSRADAAYSYYHNLIGYIFTFVRDYPGEPAPYAEDRPARYRIRRCPGFNLIAEERVGYSRPHTTYHITIIKRGGNLALWVNGEQKITAHDDEPLSEGLLGLRTFRTKLWWDNIRVTSLRPEGEQATSH